MQQGFYDIQQPDDESMPEQPKDVVPSLNHREWRQPKVDKKASLSVLNSTNTGLGDPADIPQMKQHESWKRKPKGRNSNHSQNAEASEQTKVSASSKPLKIVSSNSVTKGSTEDRAAVNTSFDAVRDEIDDEKLMRRTLLLQDISEDTTEEMRTEITQPYLSLLHGGGGVLARWLDATTCCIVFSTEALCQRGIDRAARKSTSTVLLPKLLLNIESMQTPEVFRGTKFV